jgi:hypothetical protein
MTAGLCHRSRTHDHKGRRKCVEDVQTCATEVRPVVRLASLVLVPLHQIARLAGTLSPGIAGTANSLTKHGEADGARQTPGHESVMSFGSKIYSNGC